MDRIDPARLSLVVSLCILGISLAAFANAAGLVPAAATGSGGEIIVDGETVTVSVGSESETIVEDASEVGQIEISSEGDRVTITTDSREPPHFTDRQRDRARQTALANETLADRLEPTGGAELTVVPIDTSSTIDDGPALAELDPDAARRAALEARTGPDNGFEIASNGSADSVALERDDPSIVTDRAIVLVEPVGEPVEYRLVVDLEREIVDRIVQLEFVVG